MSSKCAFFFPGQGAQYQGMAADLVAGHAEAREVFDAGREILGFDIQDVCANGPAEELNSTRVSQPAIFLHSVAVLRILEKKFGTGLPAAAAAGLSLGEYSALVFVGALEFEGALRIVGKRGEYMQEACDARKGAMTSVLGLEAPRVEEIVEKARAEGLEVAVANYNSPAQTVISGEEGAVQKTAELLKEAGARRAVPLTVAGAYHSPLMALATAKLEPLLEGLKIRAPRLPFFANYRGGRVEDPEEIRQGLVRQVESPVRWVQCLQGMLAQGVERGVELGPGKVIQGLVRNVERTVKVDPIGDLEALDNLKALPV